MKRIMIAVVLGMVMLGRAEAGFITYTESVTASGSVGLTTFTNALVIISATGDTNNITTPSAGVFEVPVSVSFTVAGGPSGTFTQPFVMDDVQNSGFAAITQGTPSSLVSTLLGVFNKSALSTYALNTSIGPVTGAGEIGRFAFSSTAGDFVFNTQIAPVTFQATLGNSAVPEPSSLLLAGTGALMGLGYFGRKRRRATAA